MKKSIWIILMILMMPALIAGCAGQNDPGKDTAGTSISDMELEQKDDSDAETEGTTKSEESTKEEMTSEENTETEATDATTEEELTTEQEEPTTEEEKEIVLDESKAVKVFVTASTLNLRKSPNTSSEVLKVLKRGTEIKKYEENDGWAVVKAGSGSFSISSIRSASIS